ncbi:hypothetical protein B0H13DRAFT_1916065 [Mycena leptocephala]|nr:hypothetical protein B0H13DRAFT_1916065 [Mycena leptocephala]
MRVADGPWMRVATVAGIIQVRKYSNWRIVHHPVNHDSFATEQLLELLLQLKVVLYQFPAIKSGSDLADFAARSRLEPKPSHGSRLACGRAAATLDFHTYVGPQYLSAVLEVYNDALVSADHAGIAMANISLVGSVAMEWKSLKHCVPWGRRQTLSCSSEEA